MKPIALEDFTKFQFLSDVAYSPDGAGAVFAVHKADMEENGYLSQLWHYCKEQNKLRPLTSWGDARSFIWLDNTTILFASRRDKKTEKGHTAFYRLSVAGGEAQPAFTVPHRVQTIKRIEGDRFLLTIRQPSEEKPKAEKNRAEDGKDFHVFDELPFWFNGKGVVNKDRTSAYLFDAATGEEKRITSQYFDTGLVRLSPDHTKVLYSGVDYQDVAPREDGLFLYDMETGKTLTIVEPGKMSIDGAEFTSDKILYAGTTYEWPGRSPNYFIYYLKTGQTKTLPFLDAPMGNGVGTDSAYGGTRQSKYSVGRVYTVHTRWGDSHLVSVDSEGALQTHTKQPGAVLTFDVFGKTALMIAMRGQGLAELYSLDLTTGAETKLTSFNDAYLSEHNVIEPEHFTFKNSDGWELGGYVLKPAGYQPGKKYPGVLEIHGGPKAAFGSVYHHEMQALANRGYFVFYTNPRGSDGRGEEFANITGKLGTIDYQDLMEFTDEVIRRYPDLDEKKIAACGGSYGGFMCNWMVGHTDRFAAAASQRSISNYLSKSLTTDIGFNHNMSQLETTPWEDFDRVWETSPLKCAHKANTPTLFIQSDEDYRCWMCDALQMYTALKLRGVPTKLCLFHGENHNLSRNGRPKNRLSRLTEIAEWFDRYLK